MYKIGFYVPLKDAERVKMALFSKGAGKYENYDQCSFEYIGKGQFRPLNGSQPTLGKVGTLEFVDELRVEMICQDDYIKDVIKTLKETHPYEVVAYDVVELLDF